MNNYFELDLYKVIVNGKMKIITDKQIIMQLVRLENGIKDLK